MCTVGIWLVGGLRGCLTAGLVHHKLSKPLFIFGYCMVRYGDFHIPLEIAFLRNPSRLHLSTGWIPPITSQQVEGFQHRSRLGEGAPTRHTHKNQAVRRNWHHIIHGPALVFPQSRIAACRGRLHCFFAGRMNMLRTKASAQLAYRAVHETGGWILCHSVVIRVGAPGLGLIKAFPADCC